VKYLAVFTALILYFIFSVASALAGVIGLLALPFCPKYTANVMHSMDMLLAALFGWDGRSTVSKECGKSDCAFCRVLCWVLHYILERKHCEKEAAK
jgi:hypothetical protein